MTTSPVFNVSMPQAASVPEKEEEMPPNEMVTIALAVGAVALGTIGIFALAFIAATFLTGGGFAGVPIGGSIALGSFAVAAFLIQICYRRAMEARTFAKKHTLLPPSQQLPPRSTHHNPNKDIHKANQEP